MIGLLRGTYKETSDQYILVDITGVGYAVFVPTTLRSRIKPDTEITLFVSTQVKEDAIELYGFARQEEKQLFELLRSVSGIGPKTSLAIVGHGVSQVETAITTADVEFFSGIPRIGKKNAQKIIIELKNKLGGIGELNLKDQPTGQRQEILEALTNMGFPKSDVGQFIHDHMDEKKSLEENIKHALQFLGRYKK
jgi:holliday junction DNA helicase RuvA